MSTQGGQSPTLEEVKQQAQAFHEERQVGERTQLVVFKLGTEEYAVGIDEIKEVVITPRVAKVPQTAKYIKGVANIRGNIIAIMDLEDRFELERAAVVEGSSNFTLVLQSEEYKVGILVHQVPETLSVNVADIDGSAEFARYTSLDEKSLRGIVKSGDRMIIILRVHQIVIDDDHVKRTNAL
jgi:purine-binding chemotaxis protein CheW